MEPITHFTDYPSLYPQIIVSKDLEMKWYETIEKIKVCLIRKRMGGNEGIHKVKSK